MKTTRMGLSVTLPNFNMIMKKTARGYRLSLDTLFSPDFYILAQDKLKGPSDKVRQLQRVASRPASNLPLSPSLSLVASAATLRHRNLGNH
jgi:hypothetical protein